MYSKYLHLVKFMIPAGQMRNVFIEIKDICLTKFTVDIVIFILNFLYYNS